MKFPMVKNAYTQLYSFQLAFGQEILRRRVSSSGAHEALDMRESGKMNEILVVFFFLSFFFNRPLQA